MHLCDKTTTKNLLEVVVGAGGPISIAICAAVRIAVGMMAICIAVRTTCSVPITVMIHWTIQVTITTGLLHLLVGLAPDGRVVRLEARTRVAGAHGGEEVDVEGEDIKGKDECDGPFEHGGGVGGLFEVACCEGDGEDYLDDNKDELDPKRDAEDPVGTVVWFPGVSLYQVVIMRERVGTYERLDADIQRR
jgi:hypothetical protein